MSENQPSEWQQKITGEWYGSPSVFDVDGTHQGYEKVARASVFEDGKTIYWMRTELIGGGPLRARFELADQFEFAVRDSDQHRIYQGPDFYGAGEPFGAGISSSAMVDAHYYSPAWQADLRTMVHVLADGETQVYSSLLYEGPTIVAVFNGVYKVAFDYETNAETRTRIDAFTDKERQIGPRPQVLPTKRSGRWTGVLEVFDNAQKHAGDAQIQIRHQPIDLLRSRQTYTLTGAIEREFTVERTRTDNRVTFHGPDAWGNGRTYGRALYPSYHLSDEATKIKGREFLYDDEGNLSLVWQFCQGEVLDHAAYGQLAWEADA